MLESKEMARFGLRLDPKIKKTLEQLSELRGISASGLIRMLIIREKMDFKEELLHRGCYQGELDI